MTVAATTTAVQYVQNGTTTQFSYPNKIFSASDLIVTDINPATIPPTLTVLALGTNYTVSNVDVDTGALVTLLVAGVTGHTLDIRTQTALTQSTSVKNQGAFYPELHEEAFDRFTRQIQDLTRLAYTFGIHGPDTETVPWKTLPAASVRAGTTLVFDVSGQPGVGVTPTTTFTQALFNNYLASSTLYSQTAAELAAGITPTNYAINSDWLDPRRYGAVGDGVTDDTAAMTSWVAVVNAFGTTPCVCTWPTGKTFLCGILPFITAANLTIYAGSTLLNKANTMTSGTSWVQFNCTTLRLICLTFNGNQANYSASGGNALAYFNTQSDLLLDGCVFTQSAQKGAVIAHCTGGRISNCHFDYNANLGLERNVVSYLKYVNCTFDNNGSGLNTAFNAVSPVSPSSFVAFGTVCRFRSHHETFTNCQAKQNGRDGMCTNQGSYAIKYIGCLCWENNDSGFTLAADSTSPGTPGDGESCWDIEYIDCEGYNNWASGLGCYAPAYNITVLGGRYYNNNRLAGYLAPASSYMNGVYFAAGSVGLDVKTKAYDDRQLCAITAVSGGTLTATGWGTASGAFVATAQSYPRVSLYNANMQWQGYANITAESSGSVTVATTTYNGVTLANIAAGWFVTQRVQHNGVFFDNDCQGQIDVDAFGHLSGYYAYSGYKSVSGWLASGQNVLVPEQPLDYTELLANPTFDAGITNWTFNNNGGTGSEASYTTAGAYVRSPGAVELIGGTQGVVGDAALIAGGLDYVMGATVYSGSTTYVSGNLVAYNGVVYLALQTSTGNLPTNATYFEVCPAQVGTYVEASCWSWSLVQGGATLQIFWNPAGSNSYVTTVTHPGGGWKQLKIGAFIPFGTTSLDFRIGAAANQSVFFDNATLKVRTDKFDNRDYAPSSRCLAV